MAGVRSHTFFGGFLVGAVFGFTVGLVTAIVLIATHTFVPGNSRIFGVLWLPILLIILPLGFVILGFSLAALEKRRHLRAFRPPKTDN